jgi:hypothetical protein
MVLAVAEFKALGGLLYDVLGFAEASTGYS